MTKKNTNASYLTRQDSDGCDDLVVIYDAKTGEEILSIPYWATDTEWASQAVAKAELLIANQKLLLSLRGASETKINTVLQSLRVPTPA